MPSITASVARETQRAPHQAGTRTRWQGDHG